MEALYIVAFCLGICAIFFAGWCAMVVGTVIHAVYKGDNVYIRIKPLLDEL
jgi:hypothetical protein